MDTSASNRGQPFKLYLDVDVLLGIHHPSRPKKRLAFFVEEFLDFITRNFSCYWLTPLCDGRAGPVLEYLFRYCSNRDDVKYLLRRIAPVAFTTPRTNVFSGGERFFWVTPNISTEEYDFLKNEAPSSVWIGVETRKNPAGLREVIAILRSELSRDT